MESVCIQHLRTRWFVSEISLVRAVQSSLVRFPILDQLARKYSTHTLSVKYSIYMFQLWRFLGRLPSELGTLGISQQSGVEKI